MGGSQVRAAGLPAIPLTPLSLAAHAARIIEHERDCPRYFSSACVVFQ